jgi:hypothetical protein
VIQRRREQPTLWHQGLAKDVEDLWEPWMKEADRLLEDAALLESVSTRKADGIRTAARSDGCRRWRRWRCSC